MYYGLQRLIVASAFLIFLALFCSAILPRLGVFHALFFEDRQEDVQDDPRRHDPVHGPVRRNRCGQRHRNSLGSSITPRPLPAGRSLS